MSNPERSEPGPSPTIEEFLGEPTRDLSRWRWLWERDVVFPIRSHRPGALGRMVIAFKRFLRPAVRAPQADLWDRQRIFNLVALEYLEGLTRSLEQVRGDLLRDLREVRSDLLRDVQNNHRRISHLEEFKREGFGDVMQHSDALYAVLDQKLDRYRRESEKLWSRLGSLLSRIDSADSASTTRELARGWEEQAYRELEDRFRGTEQEIRQRMTRYLPLLSSAGEVLDLGCGRGEALAILAEHGIAARGIDQSTEMVEICKRQGLSVERGDLLAALEEVPEASLGGIISLHVIEHLPTEKVDRLVRLSRRALAPGGSLILESPNPLSVIVAARNFWRDPTHRKPIHPETLAFVFEQAGFDPVERLDLHPFAPEERLPEIEVADLEEGMQPLAARVNELRDRLDELLFGYQDYAIVGTRPA